MGGATGWKIKTYEIFEFITKCKVHNRNIWLPNERLQFFVYIPSKTQYVLRLSWGVSQYSFIGLLVALIRASQREKLRIENACVTGARPLLLFRDQRDTYVYVGSNYNIINSAVAGSKPGCERRG